jgi:hypothetical protein
MDHYDQFAVRRFLLFILRHTICVSRYTKLFVYVWEALQIGY